MSPHRHWEEQAKKKHEEEKKSEKNTTQDSGFRWSRGFLACSVFLVVFFVVLILANMNEDMTDNSRDETPLKVDEKIDSEINAVSGKSMLTLLKNGQQPCGNYLLNYGEGEDEDWLKDNPDLPNSINNHKEFITISDKHGIVAKEIKGLGITQVICTDINNDQTLDLFIEVWKGGNSSLSFDTFVYSLNLEIEKIFQNSNKTQGIKDLNDDGYKEIITYYYLEYFGGLCHACSPYPPLVLCMKENTFNDCTEQFPDYLLEILNENKNRLQLKLKKPRVKSDPINLLGRETVEILVLGRMLGQEKQALIYLKRHLPSKVFKWMEGEKEKLNFFLTKDRTTN